MAKFDLSKLTEKIDLDKIAKSVKSGVESVKETVGSVVSPGSHIPDVKEGDVVGAKMTEILLCVNKLAEEHDRHAKEVTNLKRMVVDLQKLLAAVQVAQAGEGEVKASVSVTAVPKAQPQAPAATPHPKKPVEVKPTAPEAKPLNKDKDKPA